MRKPEPKKKPVQKLRERVSKIKSDPRAMVIAGLCASGTTYVEDINFIERGYEDFVGKLTALGADIRIEDFPDDDDQDMGKAVKIS